MNGIDERSGYEVAVELLRGLVGQPVRIDVRSQEGDTRIVRMTDVTLASLEDVPEEERTFAGHEVELALSDSGGRLTTAIRFGSEIFLGAGEDNGFFTLNLAEFELVIEAAPSVEEAM